LPLEKHPDLLVGMETADDAGVYKLSEETALVQTVDVITPIVDDPHRFGQIAAANAISDIYAMGGKPLTAMNIIGFPRLSLDLAVLTEILQGGLEKIHEAGAVLMGG
jgi:selenide,water dikinase